MPEVLHFGLTACLICIICVIKIYIFEVINMAIKSPSSIWKLVVSQVWFLHPFSQSLSFNSPSSSEFHLDF